MVDNTIVIPSVKIRNDKKSNPYSYLAMAVVKTALIDLDSYFFKTEWGKVLMTLAGVEGNREDFIKYCEVRKCI